MKYEAHGSSMKLKIKFLEYESDDDVDDYTMIMTETGIFIKEEISWKSSSMKAHTPTLAHSCHAQNVVQSNQSSKVPASLAKF